MTPELRVSPKGVAYLSDYRCPKCGRALGLNVEPEYVEVGPGVTGRLRWTCNTCGYEMHTLTLDESGLIESKP